MYLSGSKLYIADNRICSNSDNSEIYALFAKVVNLSIFLMKKTKIPGPKLNDPDLLSIQI